MPGLLKQQMARLPVGDHKDMTPPEPWQAVQEAAKIPQGAKCGFMYGEGEICGLPAVREISKGAGLFTIYECDNHPYDPTVGRLFRPCYRK
jgi:hypothetical protein